MQLLGEVRKKDLQVVIDTAVQQASTWGDHGWLVLLVATQTVRRLLPAARLGVFLCAARSRIILDPDFRFSNGDKSGLPTTRHRRERELSELLFRSAEIESYERA